MKQRSLVEEMLQSEVNATLENLSRFGVTYDGMKMLRNRELPNSFGKQLAACINAGSFRPEKVLLPFMTFRKRIGSPGLKELHRDANYRFHIDECVGCKDLERLPEILPVLSSEEMEFIILEEHDIFPFTTPILDQLLNDAWLETWSRDNMMGITLKLCRDDTAPFLVPFCREFLRLHKEEIWIATKPSEKVPGVLGFQKGEGDRLLELHLHPISGGFLPHKMIFRMERTKVW
jgi:hypothetical protein